MPIAFDRVLRIFDGAGRFRIVVEATGMLKGRDRNRKVEVDRVMIEAILERVDGGGLRLDLSASAKEIGPFPGIFGNLYGVGLTERVLVYSIAELCWKIEEPAIPQGR